VSLLFSGGVFRGVYLMGVINALNELRVQPDLIAGSSIGSITAAMAARLFTIPAADQAQRRRRIVRMAATYLAIDRLILTDRFADFIRNFTLRAGATEFSLRDLDTSFRIFDRSGTGEFGRELRRVLAGLERLLYISPFEARHLAYAFRMRHYDQVKALSSAYAQEWLERSAVGTEIFGSEPLALLIREHVLAGIAAKGEDRAAALVQQLGQNGIQFIATATNLTLGSLDSLYIPPVPDKRRARLFEALLASSAFPAVFRPRWTWEVTPETSCVEQYIDGGVMDNLPLDDVARFLNDAWEQRTIKAHPVIDGVNVPHLLFTASLEVNRPNLSPEACAYTAKRWIEVYHRAKELSYNKKIDSYAEVQRALRHIWEKGGAHSPQDYEPLNLEVVAVMPEWLCGTFAFHPMLGFRRADQARSIAHGCKTTLERLYILKKERPEWVAGWRIELGVEWLEEV